MIFKQDLYAFLYQTYYEKFDKTFFFLVFYLTELISTMSPTEWSRGV